MPVKFNIWTGKLQWVVDLASHLADKNNPHEVTLDQAYDAASGEDSVINVDNGSLYIKTYKTNGVYNNFIITDENTGTTPLSIVPGTGSLWMRDVYWGISKSTEPTNFLTLEAGLGIGYHGTVAGRLYSYKTLSLSAGEVIVVGKSIEPWSDNKFDLGRWDPVDPNKRWRFRNLYLSGRAHMNSGYFGDGSTNYADFSSTGLLTLHGTARVRKNVEIAVGSIKPPASHPASWTDLGIAGAWEFSDGVTETVILELPLPLDIDRSEDVVVEIAWSSPSTSGNCVWQLQYLFRGDDEDISASADDTLTQTVAPSTTANGLVTTSFTIPAADISDTDKLLILRLERLGGDTNDTLGDVAHLTAMNLNYVSNKLGQPIA